MPEESPTHSLENVEEESLEEQIVDVLNTIYDPEIPVPIYQLGLIYGIEIDEDNNVHIEMTLTAPNCPAAESLPRQVEMEVGELPDVNEVNVQIVFDPPYSPDMMSEEAKMQLGMM